MGFETTIRSVGESLAKAGRGAAPGLKEAASTAYGHSKAGLHEASSFIKANGGWWGASKQFAKDRPLVTGAAAVTTGVVATHAVFGNHQRDQMNRRAQSHEIYR